MSRIYRTFLFLSLAVAFVACSENGPTPPEHVNQEIGAALSPLGQEDPGLAMRAGLRAMPEAEYLSMVERSGNLVMVGFKEPGTARGVSPRGVPLVSEVVKDERTNTVALQFADTVIYRFNHIPAVAMRLPTPQAALAIRRLPWVDYVAPSSGLVTPDMLSGCAPIALPQTTPWNIQQVRADEAWALATGDAPEALVLLDDGADEGGGWYDQELYWGAYTYYTPSTSNDGNHGTAVLGAAQADDNSVGTVGVAPTSVARVMKIYDPNDPKWETYAAMAVDDNATLASVMTISYSIKQTSPMPTPTMVGLHDAIVNAYYQHGVLFTASTGNEGEPDLHAYPASFDEVIGVGGSGHNDEYLYNNYAPGNVDIAAPAVDVLTVCKGGDIGEASGTSYSTPMVAGAIMLLREEFPTISADSLTSRLLNTAVPMAYLHKSGAGRLDVAAALGIPLPPSPVVDISGPTFIKPGATCTWSAVVSGGTPPYSYAWYNDHLFVGSNPSYTGSKDSGNIGSSFPIKLVVTDAASQWDSHQITVHEDSSAMVCMI